MRLKLFIIALLACLVPAFAQAQDATIVGQVVNGSTGAPLTGANVSLRNSSASVVTNIDGRFSIKSQSGNQYLIVQCDGFEAFGREILVSAKIVNADVIRLTPNDLSDEFYGDSDDMAYDEALLEDEEGNSQGIAALTGANDNVYYNTASYNFGPMYFKFRGLQNEYQQVYMNGVNLNDPIRGSFTYATLLGLTSRAFRNKTTTIGTDAAAYGFGGIGGAVNYNTITDTYAPGFNGSLYFTNSNYLMRGMVTYSTGMNKNGWAFTISANGRYAKEGVIDGTFYNSAGLFLSLEKKFNPNHSLTLTAFGGPTQRATSSPTYQEVYDLVGSNLYNPNWGWQDGKKRASRIINSFDPTFMLTWLYKDMKTTVNTTAALRWTHYRQSALQYYMANDPNPTYYRYLPSYYDDDPAMAALYTDLWTSKDPSVTQINWDNLYYVNQLNNLQNQSLPDAEKRGASYIMENRHSNMFSVMLNSYLNRQLNDKFSLQGGLSFNYSKGTYYKTIRDLLGGDFWVDIDPFSDRDIAIAPDNLQNDIDHPNRRVTKGDRFGYDYDLLYLNALAWLQNTYTSRHWDFNYGFKMSFTQYWRQGHMRNGRAPLDSYGRSARLSFNNGSFKAGATYKPNGRNFLMAHFEYGTRAPLADKVFIAPRVKNTTIANPKSEQDISIDLTYGWNYRRFRGSFTAYYINMDDVTERTGFYDDRYSTYAIYALSGVRKVNKGFELGMAFKITPSLTATFAGTFARYNYKNNPQGTRSFENGLYADTTQTVYLKNYFQGSVPQQVYNLGLDWAAPKNWFFNVNGTWQDDAYVNLSPAYHEAIPDMWTVYPDPDQLEQHMKLFTSQEKLKGAFSLNLSIGKLLYINRKVSMNFNLNINNVLNNKNVVTYAYQQGRIDTKNFDPSTYPNRYSYAQGIRASLNIGVRF